MYSQILRLWNCRLLVRVGTLPAQQRFFLMKEGRKARVSPQLSCLVWWNGPASHSPFILLTLVISPRKSNEQRVLHSSLTFYDPRAQCKEKPSRVCLDQQEETEAVATFGVELNFKSSQSASTAFTIFVPECTIKPDRREESKQTSGLCPAELIEDDFKSNRFWISLCPDKQFLFFSGVFVFFCFRCNNMWLESSARLLF